MSSGGEEPLVDPGPPAGTPLPLVVSYRTWTVPPQEDEELRGWMETGCELRVRRELWSVVAQGGEVRTGGGQGGAIHAK